MSDLFKLRFIDHDCKRFIYILERLMGQGFTKDVEISWRANHETHYMKVFSRRPQFAVIQVSVVDAPDCGYSGLLITDSPDVVTEFYKLEKVEPVKEIVKLEVEKV